MKNIKQYYKELGKLLYAVAMADGAVQPEEVDKLHAFVMKELAHFERTYDSSGMNHAFYVDFEFEDNTEKHTPLNGTVKKFREFIEQNAESGDEALIDRSVRLMEAVAFAYAKKREKDLLEQVKNITEHLIELKKRHK